MADLATASDIAAQWRALSSDEEVRAAALLARASAIIRARFPDVDDRITAGSLDAELVGGVAVDMVVRRMQKPSDGVSSVTTDDTTFRWETGRGDTPADQGLVMTSEEIELLTGPAHRKPRVGTIHANPTLRP